MSQDVVEQPEQSARKPPQPRLHELLAAARTRRMLGVLAIIVVAAVVCARLGAWQIERAFERADAARAAEAAQLSDAAPVPLPDLLEPAAHVMGVMVGQPVEVTGVFDPAGQVLVPDRIVDGESGFLVVTPLQVTDTGAWLAVVRGWTAEAGEAPAAPSGSVTLTGAVTAGESFEPAVLPQGQVNSISPAYFAGVWGLPIYNAYFVPGDAVQDPGAAGGVLRAVPTPQLDGGSGVDLRNLAYAVEWYIFGAFALLVWYRLVRDEALTRREEQDAGGADAAEGGQAI